MYRGDALVMSESERETRPLLRIVGPSVCFCKWMDGWVAAKQKHMLASRYHVRACTLTILGFFGSMASNSAVASTTAAIADYGVRSTSTSTSDRLEARQGKPVLPPLCNSTSGQPLFCALFVVGPECDLLSSPDRADHAVMAASRSLPQRSVYDNELLPEHHLPA